MATVKLPTFKYQRVADELRKQIRSGALRPGDRLPSRSEMQGSINISCVTLDKVHQTLEQEGLIVRSKGRGTFVADSPRLPKTPVIALLGFELENAEGADYWFHMIRGVHRASHRSGLDNRVIRYDGAFDSDHFDGFLIHGGVLHKIPAEVASFPSVCVFHHNPPMASVAADEADGARQAVDYLLELGHRRIGYMAWLDSQPTIQRYSGYRAALEAASIVPQAEWTRNMRYCTGDRRYKADMFHVGFTNMRRWLGQGFLNTGCTALLAQNDIFALGIIKALREAKLQVPRDISVVGFDGIEEAQRCSPTLTTVAVPLEQAAETAIGLLVRLIGGEALSNRPLVLPTHLQIGESTAAPRARV